MLNTGKDFVIIDFEGEPALPERAEDETLRPARCRRDDALLSLRRAHRALRAGRVPEEDIPYLTPWAGLWARAIGRIFIEAYLSAAGISSFVPAAREDVEVLLEAFLLEKATYEVGYELNNRPEWVVIPIRGIGIYSGRGRVC